MSKYKKIFLTETDFLGNEWRYVKKCIDTGWVASGDFIDNFEYGIRKYTGTKHAVSCVNGTAGLQIALRVIGIKCGDEVIVPALTFIATVNAVRYLGAEPVFMDCDENMNLDSEKFGQFCRKECVLTKRGLVNKKTKKIIKAVIPVHVFGIPCDMENIMSIAKSSGLKVIEDATESLGSRYIKGKYKNRFTGTIGNVGVYSFNGNKIITAGGGGMIVSDKAKVAKKSAYLINQAKDDSFKFIHDEIGYNFRISNIQAALGLAQLERLDDIIRVKIRNFKLYQHELQDVTGLSLMVPPDNCRPNYWLYLVIIKNNSGSSTAIDLCRKINKQGIEVRPIWYLNHLQKPYKNCQSYKIERAPWFWRKAFNIPSHSRLTEKDIRQVSSTLKILTWKSCKK